MRPLRWWYGLLDTLAAPIPWSNTTYAALVMLVALWAAQFRATWGAWGSLTIDSGHEMYIPALLAQGKVLYRDVWFPYGPAAPYLNSYLFRLFGAHLNVLYWAGALSALGSAIFLFLAGQRLSAWHVGWTAGAVVLLEAFQPSVFCFPLPYSFAAVYGCLIACLFLWLAIAASAARSSWWMLGAGTAAAAALLVKPEFGAACYATVGLLVAVRGYLQRSWGRVARDVLAVLPGVALCGVVIMWMVSIAGVEFITQENLVSWPTSYFMKTYGPMWLERNGFTVSLPAFEDAWVRAVPSAAVLLGCYCVLWWETSKRRANLLRVMLLLAMTLYCTTSNTGSVGFMQTAEHLLTSIVFSQVMVLYVSLAAPIAWYSFWVRRKDDASRPATVAILLTFSGLLAWRILMRMRPNEYPIYYNGPAVLSFRAAPGSRDFPSRPLAPVCIPGPACDLRRVFGGCGARDHEGSSAGEQLCPADN
jgi:hypothetical protein